MSQVQSQQKLVNLRLSWGSAMPRKLLITWLKRVGITVLPVEPTIFGGIAIKTTV